MTYQHLSKRLIRACEAMYEAGFPLESYDPLCHSQLAADMDGYETGTAS